uniref:Translocation protein SEC62 n=1 Tax=Chinchilla lanigera TaxID=34839 RepID=A0A8C2YPN4_CHILA
MRHKKQIQEVCEPAKEEKAVLPPRSLSASAMLVSVTSVDCLLDTKSAKAKKGEEALFTTRESVVDYCNRLLKKQFFHQALKVMKMKYDKTIKKDDKKENTKEEKTKKEKKDGKREDSRKEETLGTPKKKETKKKLKLEPHDDQVFLDGNEVHVWVYDPVHIKTFVTVLILVIAVIAATLFPLWPKQRRLGVYYLSVGAGCFVASILLLPVARCILFLIIWLITGGRHHFWFLPNLTADMEYKGPKADFKKDEKSETKTQQKSDSEEKSDSEKKEDEEGKVENHGQEGNDRREDDRSQHSSGNGNDFEMIRNNGDCEEEEEEDNDGETPISSHEKSQSD